MNVVRRIINALRPGEPAKQAPESEPAVSRKSHNYGVRGDSLAPTAASLDEFYEIQDMRHQAQEVFRTMQYAEELAGEDNSPLDSDSRDGHVRIEEHGFEAHPDSGFSLRQGEIQVAGDGERIQTTSLSDTWMAAEQSATWDKKEQTFVLSFQPKPGPETSRSPLNLIESETVSATEDSRASQLIRAAEYWQEKAESLDNSAGDLNALPGETVAPGVFVEEAEPVMGEAFYVDEGARNFQFFDLQQTAEGTIVAGNRENGGRPFGAKLTSHRSADSMEVHLERPEIGTSEKVEWAISDGILHYEKYKKG